MDFVTTAVSNTSYLPTTMHYSYARCGSENRFSAYYAFRQPRPPPPSPESPPPALPPAPAADYDFETEDASWDTAEGGEQASQQPLGFTLTSGSTPSTTTGPSAGHGGSGSYYFAETSGSHLQEEDRYELAYDGAACRGYGRIWELTFYYHMYGTGVGNLQVVGTGSGTLWQISGEQGDVWHEAQVAVHDVKFSFVYFRGPDYRGDAAVDSVSVTCERALPAPSLPPSPNPPVPPTSPPTPPISPLPPQSPPPLLPQYRRIFDFRGKSAHSNSALRMNPCVAARLCVVRYFVRTS